jgi:hypothetical protein
MKVITVGHRYELASFEGGEPQVIQFIEKTPNDPPDGTLLTLNDGTTNEEVLAVLRGSRYHNNKEALNAKVLLRSSQNQRTAPRAKIQAKG